VVYTFFDYNDRQKQTPVGIIRSLLKQIVSPFDTVPREIIDLYASRATDPDLSTLLEQFYTCAERFDSIYILFDAFDECDDSQQKKILTLIHEFVLHKSLRIMLTSRTHPQRVPRLPESIFITINAEDADIRAFLSSRLEEELYLAQEFKDDILEALSQGAEGMY
jgi:hypothetical protein